MSKEFLLNGFVWWDESEIEKREALVRELAEAVRRTLREINQSIQVYRVETPCMVPQDWAKGHLPYYLIDDRYAMRGESTRGTYEVFNQLNPRLPVCIYQVNKSFRDEKSDAMRSSKMRYREFWQIEFQLFYSKDTKADYHELFVRNFKWHGEFKTLPKEEWPPYSERTTDIEINNVEVASLSTRNDFKVPVFEMSFGLDRIIQLTAPGAE